MRNLMRIVFMAPLLAYPAQAHEWYSPQCCSGRDCHPVNCEDLHENADGSLTYGPSGITFRKDQIHPSQDARCHICTSQPETDTGTPYCAYVVQGE